MNIFLKKGAWFGVQLRSYGPIGGYLQLSKEIAILPNSVVGRWLTFFVVWYFFGLAPEHDPHIGPKFRVPWKGEGLSRVYASRLIEAAELGELGRRSSRFAGAFLPTGAGAPS